MTKTDPTFLNLFVEGLATRDFEPALRLLVGQDAPLSASTISRLTAEFRKEYEAFDKRVGVERSSCTSGPMGWTSRLRTHAAWRFKKTRSGVCLVYQVMVRLSRSWRRLTSAHLCPTIPLPEFNKKKAKKSA